MICFCNKSFNIILKFSKNVHKLIHFSQSLWTNQNQTPDSIAQNTAIDFGRPDLFLHCLVIWKLYLCPVKIKNSWDWQEFISTSKWTRGQTGKKNTITAHTAWASLKLKLEKRKQSCLIYLQLHCRWSWEKKKRALVMHQQWSCGAVERKIKMHQNCTSSFSFDEAEKRKT
jgi:hypothetical protein